jgi:hypothetical protein
VRGLQSLAHYSVSELARKPRVNNLPFLAKQPESPARTFMQWQPIRQRTSNNDKFLLQSGLDF